MATGRGRGGRRSRQSDSPDVRLSKSMSWVLRHGAEKSGFELQEGGFLYVDEVLSLPQLKNHYSLEDVQRVVENNEKKRFHLEPHPEDGRLRIRANQGHTIEVEGLELNPITSAEDYPIVIHGTYFKCWESIKQLGLSRMNRNHIHMAPGEPGESGVISGMRGSCDVLVYIDLAKALQAGIPFLVSSNNVVLSPGDDQGYIAPEFFKQVIDRRNRKQLEFES